MKHITAKAIMIAAAALIVIIAGASNAAAVRTYVGESAQVGDGTITSWMTTDAKGTPMSVGVNLSQDALSGLPAGPTEYVLTLPGRAAPFTHFALDWEPHGHAPAAIYGVPHFDFHFYMISPAARAQITGEATPNAMRRPAQRYIPDNYQPDVAVVPHMGVHWGDPASPEFHGQPFTSTFIYGFYNGRMAFIEPMITTQYLASNPELSQSVAVPQAYQQAGYYPTRYAVKYDPAKRSYIIALQGLRYRKAG